MDNLLSRRSLFLTSYLYDIATPHGLRIRKLSILQVHTRKSSARPSIALIGIWYIDSNICLRIPYKL